MKLVILLSGFASFGKNAVGEILCKNHGFRTLAFASILKRETAKKYNFDVRLTWTEKGKKTMVLGKSVRDHLVEYGLAQRKKDINVWVKPVIDEILESNHDKWVITDYRFPNEYNQFKENNNFILLDWRVYRNIDRIVFNEAEDAITKKPDSYIFNVQDFDFLEKQVKKNLNRIVLIDCDDTLFDWKNVYKEWFHKTNKNTILSEEYFDVQKMKLFNDTDPDLPVICSKENINQIRNQFGSKIIAVSSCGYIKSRKMKLQELGIDEYIQLPLCSSKTDIFKLFENVTVIDDNLEHIKEAKKLGHDSFSLHSLKF